MSVRKQFAVYYIIKWSRGWNLTLGLPGAFSNVWGILLKKRKGNNWNTPRSEIISYSATEGVWLLWCQAMKYIYQRRFFSLTKINLLLTRFVCERKKWCMFFSFFFKFLFRTLYIFSVRLRLSFRLCWKSALFVHGNIFVKRIHAKMVLSALATTTRKFFLDGCL